MQMDGKHIIVHITILEILHRRVLIILIAMLITIIGTEETKGIRIFSILGVTHKYN